MARIHFGHCIGCDEPIRPPFLSFKVMWDTGSAITEWEDVDVCEPCGGKLTADELHRLVREEPETSAAAARPTEADIEAAMTPAGGWTRETLAKWGVPWPPPKDWKAALLAPETSDA